MSVNAFKTKYDRHVHGRLRTTLMNDTIAPLPLMPSLDKQALRQIDSWAGNSDSSITSRET